MKTSVMHSTSFRLLCVHTLRPLKKVVYLHITLTLGNHDSHTYEVGRYLCTSNNLFHLKKVKAAVRGQLIMADKNHQLNNEFTSFYTLMDINN